MEKKRVIFCDFDGTITEEDNIVALMRHFNPLGWEEKAKQIISREISIKAGVSALFGLLPTSPKNEIIDFAVRNVTIRQGFSEFVAFCRDSDTKLVITSGGIDFFIYPLLARFGVTENIYCNGSDFSGERIRIIWPHPCKAPCENECGMCKPTVVSGYPNREYDRVLIGDSITDLAAAELVDFVIARDFLLEKCRERHLPHSAFNTFYDVINHLRRRPVGSA